MNSRTGFGEASAYAHPNIALIKYWGNRDAGLRLPVNGSISMNLDGLETRTHVRFSAELSADTLFVNGAPAGASDLARVAEFLNRVRRLAGSDLRAEVQSENNFPAGAGIASSASAFAALALAASAAAGLHLDRPALSRLARTGSGSACRSVPGGFVEWRSGARDEDSFAFSIAPPDHWDLVDCVALVSTGQKETGSTEGHALADTSPLQNARVADAPRRLDRCREAILKKDFFALAEVVEQDSHMMHAVMMTSRPPLVYWLPATLSILHAVRKWRSDGLSVCATIDAGPNVHVLTLRDSAGEVADLLKATAGIQDVLVAEPGGPASLIRG